jgi:DNA primase
VLALDPDAAGQKATMRGLEMARQAMDHSTEIVFDPRGLLRHEARLEADLRVTTLPEGKDPDEIVLRDPQEWSRIVESARPIVVHVMETLAAGRDMEDPRAKSEIAGQVLPLIEDVPNSVEREAYRQRLARLLRVDERSLIGANTQGRSIRRRPQGQKTAQPEALHTAIVQMSAHPEANLEAHILRLMLRQPESLYLLDRVLQKSTLGRFAAQDFEQADHQMLAGVILQSLEQDETDVSQYIQENMPEELDDLVRELLKPFPQGEPAPERLVEDLIQAVMRLRQVRTRAHVDQLIFMQRDVQQEEGNQRMEDYQGIHQVVMQCTRVLKSLNKALGQPIQFD